LTAFYLFQNNCLSCPANCKTCSDGSTCTSCSAGILVSNLCILCTELTYQGSIGCTACVANNNFVKCTQCQDTYFLDANGKCQQCSTFIPGAIRCTNQNTPTQCQNDYSTTLSLRYYLVGITCILNAKNCRYISDINGNCSQCYTGYTLTSGTCTLCPFTGCVPANTSVLNNVCTCALCNSGYYLTGVACTACSTANCATCPSNTCSACKVNFYLSGTNCLASTAANCLTASSATLCSVCQSGYYKGSNDLCYLCQSHCLKCSSRFVCT
jgi:proprotein convertase subtilisin/kexin type 5